MHSDHLKQLWNYLEREGLIDLAMRDRLAKTVSQGWRPLGRVLVEMGYLSVKELMRLLAIQADEPSAYLGSLAVREGYCTQSQIEQALRLQRSTTAGVYQFLTSVGGLSPEQLFDSTANYIRHLETLVSSLRQQDEQLQDA